MKRFRGGLVSKAHRWSYHSTLGLRVIKKKKIWDLGDVGAAGAFAAEEVGARPVYYNHLDDSVDSDQ